MKPFAKAEILKRLKEIENSSDYPGSQEYTWLISTLREAISNPQVKIGPYTIKELSPYGGGLWISHESGEGGQMSLESFEKMYKEWL